LSDVEIVVFDMDHTLIAQDSLYEQLRAILRFSAIKFLDCLITLITKGRVSFKKRVFQVCEEHDFNRSSLHEITVNDSVKEEFCKYKNSGITVIIATAAYWKTTFKVLKKIELIPDIIISTGNNYNLKGKIKLRYLRPYIKSSTWAYYGDSISDVPLFRAADVSYKVTANSIERVFYE